MSKINFYKHLDNNKNNCISTVLSMEEIAKQAISLNYGVHRLLSALVSEIKKQYDVPLGGFDVHPKYRPHVELANGIEELLNKGLH